MSGGIFLIQGDALVEMTGQAYEAEAVLQDLIAKYPDLLAGDQMNSAEPRRWLLVAPEVGLPSDADTADRWSVDHLFLDQDSVPTIIETKQSSNGDIRRKIVGQVLEYAANASAYWSIEKLRLRFEAQCAETGVDPADKLMEFLAGSAEPDEFWQRAGDNLRSGRMRLVFVADQIPSELQRIVEFLNQQMNPCEVFAVEVRQYAGQGQRALVPRVVGQSAVAALRKSGGAVDPGRQWDEDGFFEALETKSGAGAAAVGRKLLDWARSRGMRIWWGKGLKDGSFFPMLDHNGENWTISVWTYGRVEIQFSQFMKRPPFDVESKRLELLRRLNAVPGVSMPDDAITRRPSVLLSTLVPETALTPFFSALDWMVTEIRDT